jgi:hypothetical protein
VNLAIGREAFRDAIDARLSAFRIRFAAAGAAWCPAHADSANYTIARANRQSTRGGRDVRKQLRADRAGIRGRTFPVISGRHVVRERGVGLAQAVLEAMRRAAPSSRSASFVRPVLSRTVILTLWPSLRQGAKAAAVSSCAASADSDGSWMSVCAVAASVNDTTTLQNKTA